MNGVFLNLDLLKIVSGLILLLGVIADLRSKKVPNTLSLTCAIIALSTQVYVFGFTGLAASGLAFLAAFAFYTPFVAISALGAGDMKLMLAFSLVNSWQVVLSVSVFALVWGAILGVVRSTLNGELLGLLKSTGKVLLPSSDAKDSSEKKLKQRELHSIPYTVALMFGWMSHLVYQRGGL